MTEAQRLRAIRRLVETAHRDVQEAQRLAYASDGDGSVAPLRVRLALNKAQNVLIKLLVHALKDHA